MHTIVALGNPGKAYEKTRHNAGRLIMKAALEGWRFPKTVTSSKFGGEVSEGVVEGQEVRMFFPGTYMNDSGRAVIKAVAKEDVERMVVVYDEIDLPLGEFKLSFGRGSGGHNGLKSVIDACDTPNFLRVRVGIAPKTLFGKIVRPTGDRLSDYVLGKLSAREEKKLLALAPDIMSALKMAMSAGREQAMNRYN